VSVLVRQEGKLVVEDTVDFAAGYATWRGTSFAAANVSGQLAALMTGGRTAREALASLPGGDIVAATDEER